VYPVQANLKWWESLTASQRRTISKAIAATEGMAVADIEKEYKEDIKIAREHGNEVYIPSAMDLAQWKSLAGTMAEKNYLKQTGAVGKQLLSDIKAAVSH
jgi:TRAP-type C4-dicarboxylate transport system substrate-binding protein